MQNQAHVSDFGGFAGAQSRQDTFDSPATTRRSTQSDKLALRATGLGWFSIGLGVAELVAPEAVGKLIGARVDARGIATLRMLGLREVTTGLCILTQQKSAPWLWSRVAGDLMDLAMLGSAARRSRSNLPRLLATTAAVAGVTVLDGLAAFQHSKTHNANGQERTIVITKALTINRDANDVYAFWRDLTNQPRFMSHIKSVEVDGQLSRWTARGPGNVELTWDSEIKEDRPGELLTWGSLPGASVNNCGCVRFRAAPGGRGTELHVEIRYEPPLGPTGFTIAKLFGAVPRQMLENDLRRLKQILETGEVVHSDASIHAGPHPARSPSDAEYAAIREEA